MNLVQRFRGFAPVVIDVETGGFDCTRHALLEMACVPLVFDASGQLVTGDAWHRHVLPEQDCVCDPEALAFTGIDPHHPFREAISEADAMQDLCRWMWQHVKAQGCKRAVLVGHNAHFDLGFVLAALRRQAQKKIPLHAFTCFDTATLGGVFWGETVLAQVCRRLGLDFDARQAHSALYDAKMTAEVFCRAVNQVGFEPSPLLESGEDACEP